MKHFSNFDFQMKTEIIFGKDAELRTAEMIKKYGGTKVMIVMDGGGFIKASGLFDRVAKNLTENGLPFVELEGVQPNPRKSLVLKGLDLAKAEGVDFVLAIGGGSTMDTAKGIALGMKYDNWWDFFNGSVPEEIGLVGAIPTMAGTGSETSGSAVIYDDIDTKMKLGNMFPHIRCVFAIENPEITYSLPKFQTGAGAADIFAHSFDSYMKGDDSYLGDKFSEATMSAAVKYGPVAVNDPTNYEARAELMLTSSFAHNDVCRIGKGPGPQGAGHNMESQLTALLDTAHGAGLSVIMPAYLEYIVEHDESTIGRVAQLAVRVFGVEADPQNPKDVALRGIKKFREWLVGLGMPQTIAELKRPLTDEEIDDLCAKCWLNPDGSLACYGHIPAEGIREIYKSVNE